MASEIQLSERIATPKPENAGSVETALTASELICGYGSVPIIGPMNFSVPRGSFWLIEGPNGVGKSTLLKTLIGERPPISGAFEWQLEKQHLRFVPQTRTLDPLLPATVYDVLATGLQRGSGWQSLRLRLNHDEAFKALETVQMKEYENHLFRELSEGQKQLVLIARALIGAPKVLLLDEPAASMDPEREEATVALLKELQNAHGITVMMIAHGSTAAQEAADVQMHVCRVHGIHYSVKDAFCCPETLPHTAHA